MDWLKNQQSDRTIPIPGLAWDILQEVSYRREGDLVMVTHKNYGYRQAFIRYRDRWKSELQITPGGLRRVLRTEFFFREWDSEVLEVYRGHKHSKESVVDWQHYIEEDPEALIEIFRENVINPLNEVLTPFRGQWNGTEGKVISLPLRTV